MAKTPNMNSPKTKTLMEKSHLYWFIASIISIILTVILNRSPNAYTPFISSFIGYTIFLLLASFVIAGLMSLKDKKKLKINFISFFTSSSISILLFSLTIFSITFLLFSRIIMNEILIIVILCLFSIFVLIYSFICINHKIRGIPFGKEDRKKIIIVTVLLSLIILILSIIMINNAIEKQLNYVNSTDSQTQNDYDLVLIRINELPETYSALGEDIRFFVNQKHSERQRISNSISTHCGGFYYSDVCFEQINAYDYVTVEYVIRTFHARAFLELIEKKDVNNPNEIIDNYRNSVLFEKVFSGPYERRRLSESLVELNQIYNIEGMPNNINELRWYLFFRTNKGQITKEMVIDTLEYTNSEAKSFSILPVILPQNVLELDEPQESKAMRILVVEEFMMRR